MHDPLTQAFEIKYPWFRDKPWPKEFRKKFLKGWRSKEVWGHFSPEQQEGRSSMWPEGYRDTFLRIWHKDPERSGSNDSCGWSYPRCTDEQCERIHNLAWSEGQNPYFLKHNGRSFDGSMGDAEALERGLLLLVADVIGVKLSFEEAARMAARAIHQADCVHPSNKFCFEPGYHSNSKEDKPYHREEVFKGLCFGAAARVLDLRRPWYRHPRWHIHHWRIQIPIWQSFRRWAFEKCAKCGGRFAWEESVIGDWNGTRIWHSRCDESKPS
jgi:hypothetical protein